MLLNCKVLFVLCTGSAKREINELPRILANLSDSAVIRGSLSCPTIAPQSPPFCVFYVE